MTSLKTNLTQKLFDAKNFMPSLFEEEFNAQRVKKYETAIESWRSYRQEKARFAASNVFGGNWSTIAYYESYIQTTKDMINSFVRTNTFY